MGKSSQLYWIIPVISRKFTSKINSRLRWQNKLIDKRWLTIRDSTIEQQKREQKATKIKPRKSTEKTRWQSRMIKNKCKTQNLAHKEGIKASATCTKATLCKITSECTRMYLMKWVEIRLTTPIEKWKVWFPVPISVLMRRRAVRCVKLGGIFSPLN